VTREFLCTFCHDWYRCLAKDVHPPRTSIMGEVYDELWCNRESGDILNDITLQAAILEVRTIWFALKVTPVNGYIDPLRLSRRSKPIGVYGGISALYLVRLRGSAHLLQAIIPVMTPLFRLPFGAKVVREQQTQGLSLSLQLLDPSIHPGRQHLENAISYQQRHNAKTLLIPHRTPQILRWTRPV
jgi:hypothetical protein